MLSFRKYACILMSLLSLVACSSGEKDLSDKSPAGAKIAAEYFYELLSKGETRSYVDNMSEASELDSCKYTQFVDLLEQFLLEEQQLRGGILSAEAVREKAVEDTVSMVFLNVQFGDSTHEEIMLPIVYSRGRWWIR